MERESVTAKLSIRWQLSLEFFLEEITGANLHYEHHAKGTEETIEGAPGRKNKQYLYNEKRWTQKTSQPQEQNKLMKNNS